MKIYELSGMLTCGLILPREVLSVIQEYLFMITSGPSLWLRAQLEHRKFHFHLKHLLLLRTRQFPLRLFTNRDF